MDLYFQMPMGPISSIVLLLTTQCIGFGLAGASSQFRLLKIHPRFPRNAPEFTRYSSSNVLACHPGHRSTVHNPILSHLFCAIPHRPASHSPKTACLHASLPRDLPLPIPPIIALPYPHFGIRTVLDEQPVMVDEDIG